LLGHGQRRLRRCEALHRIIALHLHAACRFQANLRTYANNTRSSDTSLTDPWARMISYHFLNQTDRNNFFSNDSAHGAGQLWSQVPLNPLFQAHQVPFPIMQADSRPVGSNLTSVLAPEPIVYEMTPFEFGSWDPNLSAMINMSFAGTHVNNFQPANSTSCVTGFDQTGFMMGTSASLFNASRTLFRCSLRSCLRHLQQILDFADNKLNGFDSNDGQALFYVLQRQLTEVRTRANDVANWPNVRTHPHLGRVPC
jgi:lysophospholipase